MYRGVKLLVICLFSKVVLSSLTSCGCVFITSTLRAPYGQVLILASLLSSMILLAIFLISNKVECISCVYLFLLLLKSAFIGLLYKFLGFVGFWLNQSTSSYILDTCFWFYVLQSIFSEFVACFFPLFLELFPRNFNNFNVLQFISFLYDFCFYIMFKKSFHSV